MRTNFQDKEVNFVQNPSTPLYGLGSLEESMVVVGEEKLESSLFEFF